MRCANVSCSSPAGSKLDGNLSLHAVTIFFCSDADRFCERCDTQLFNLTRDGNIAATAKLDPYSLARLARVAYFLSELAPCLDRSCLYLLPPTLSRHVVQFLSGRDIESSFRARPWSVPSSGFSAASTRAALQNVHIAVNAAQLGRGELTWQSVLLAMGQRHERKRWQAVQSLQIWCAQLPSYLLFTPLRDATPPPRHNSPTLSTRPPTAHTCERARVPHILARPSHPIVQSGLELSFDLETVEQDSDPTPQPKPGMETG